MKKHWTSRTPTETKQRCARLRWHENYACGTGLEPAATPLPLVVGGAVHAGRATLLIEGQKAMSDPAYPLSWLEIEELAVAAALDEFHLRAPQPGAIALPDIEIPAAPSPVALSPVASTQSAPATGGTGTTPTVGASPFDWQALGMDPESDDARALARQMDDATAKADQWRYREQEALVEAMVRAYARRRLKPLLERYEVLEVEREGEGWMLGGWIADHTDHEVWFASRPDALLRDRETGDLVLSSLKTAASWDRRKAIDAEHDSQGLSEGIDVERRLGRWWQQIQGIRSHAYNTHRLEGLDYEVVKPEVVSTSMFNYLEGLTAPPRILGIQYEYLLKGPRLGPDNYSLSKRLSERLGATVYAQCSPLVAAYLNPGMAAGDEQWCASWDYRKPDGSGDKSKLNYRQWKAEPVWEHMTVREWIDRLDDSTEETGADTEGGGWQHGWRSAAQAVGTLDAHPLDELFVVPPVQYRNDDELRDWLEQTEAQEVAVAKAVEEVRAAEAAGDEGEVRRLLNVHFPMTRRACAYPTTCAFAKLCYGGQEQRRDPMAQGFRAREKNHPQEGGGE